MKACSKLIKGTQNRCTRDVDHAGECRCKATDVDRRKGRIRWYRDASGFVHNVYDDEDEVDNE